jgi:hypothetical protein
MLSKWQNFINESIVEFPLKKTMSLVKDIIVDNIKEGKNIFKINDNSFVEFILDIEYIKKNHLPYSGNVDIYSVIEKSMGKNTDIVIYVTVIDININYNELLSCILHELKHVFDIYSEDYQTQSFLKIDSVLTLKEIFRNNKYNYFIHLVYESLRHEIDARNSMLYDRLRWLKTYDDVQLYEEFKKTYIYKSLINMQNFDYKEFINFYDRKDLIKYTNIFIKNFDKSYDLIDLESFYEKWEKLFHELAKEYLAKAKLVIDELTIDKRPYMEKRNMWTGDFSLMECRLISQIKEFLKYN